MCLRWDFEEEYLRFVPKIYVCIFQFMQTQTRIQKKSRGYVLD